MGFSARKSARTPRYRTGRCQEASGVCFSGGESEKKPMTCVFQQENPSVHPDMEPGDARKLPEWAFPAENQRKNPRHGFFGRKIRLYIQIWNREMPGSFRSGFFRRRIRKKTTTWVFRQENPPVHPDMEPGNARKFPHIHKNATICCISENLFTMYSNK